MGRSFIEGEIHADGFEKEKVDNAGAGSSTCNQGNYGAGSKGKSELHESKHRADSQNKGNCYDCNTGIRQKTNSYLEPDPLRFRIGRFILKHFGLFSVFLGIICIALPCIVHMQAASTSPVETLVMVITDPQKIRPAPWPHGDGGYQAWVATGIFWGWILVWWGTMCCLTGAFQIPRMLEVLLIVPFFLPLGIMAFVWPGSWERTAVMLTYTVGLGAMLLAGTIDY